jgi:O-antigen ligase
MIRKSIATALKFSAVAFLLFALLFGDYMGTLLGFCGLEIAAVVRDPATQWMVVLCLAGYSITLLILEYSMLPHDKRWQLGNVNIWLATLVVLVPLRYAFASPTASGFTHVSVFLAATICGKAISTWVRWQSDCVERRAAWMISCLVCFLACSALWQPEITMTFPYHDVSRWSGPWGNPNSYGLLMGGGGVLTIGLLAQRQKAKGKRQKLLSVISIIAALIMGTGLVMSYSRGACLGTTIGLLYLAKAHGKFKSQYLKWLLLLAFGCGLLAVGFFWHTPRTAPWYFQRLDLSRGSVQHRVAAWKASFEIMCDHPFGVGWNKTVETYETNYSPPEGGAEAITTNDYLMLGTQLGIPGLVCFLAYVALCFRSPKSKQFGIRNSEFGIKAACRAAVLAMLVGFWFDGGLFKLATASVFWILLELGSSKAESGKRKVETVRDSEVGSQWSCASSNK